MPPTNLIAKKHFTNRIGHLSVLLAFVLALGAFHAQARTSAHDKGDETGLRASYGKCIDGADGATPAMQSCMSSEYAYQDKRLNTAYKALMALLNKAKQTKLRADERIWIAYRNSHCAGDPGAGQADMLSSLDCSVLETAKQAATLENRLLTEQLKQ